MYIYSHFDTPFTQQAAPQCGPAFCNPVHAVNTLRCQVSIDMAHVLTFDQGPYPRPPPHLAIISPSYIKHTGFTKNFSVQIKSYFPCLTRKKHA